MNIIVMIFTNKVNCLKETKEIKMKRIQNGRYVRFRLGTEKLVG